MVTKYDIFEIVYQNRTPIKPIEVVNKLGKDEKHYKNIHHLLVELEKENFLTRTKFGFQAKTNPQTNRLFDLIHHCLHSNINYNLLLDINLAKFIDRALRKGEISSKESSLNPRTLNKYVELLSNYGLLLIISRKPLRVKIFYNTLIRNLLVYFGFEPSIKKKKINYLPEIKQELSRYRTLRRKNEAGFRRIIEELEMSFVHHSLFLEGNPITLPDTIKILKQKIIPKNLSSEAVDEVRNYQKAILQMLEDSRKKDRLTLPTILRYHQLAMQHRPDIAGKIRKVKVYIKGNPFFKVSKVSEIKPKLNRLLEKYYAFMDKKKTLEEIIAFAAYFHNEFQHIHPFVDGNSRTARLLLFYLLQSQGIPLLDIPAGLLDEYLQNTKGAKQRIDKNLFDDLQEIILFNLKAINKRLRF